MNAGLSQAQIDAFRQDGYLSPVAVFDGVEVAQIRQAFEAFEGRHSPQAAIARRTDLHLLERWAWNVVTDPRIVAPVVSLLGPDVLLWSTNWFIKEPGDGKIVTPHQDANYWGLEPHDVLTAWVALSDAPPASGPMMFYRGSHQEGLIDHDNTYAENNLLTRGQQVKTDLTRFDSRQAPLRAGEMSLHHVRTIHGSGPNQTTNRRIGMVLRFCATHVRQTKGPDTAVVVAGEDCFNHFDLLCRPETDDGDAEATRHLDAVQRLGQILMKDDM